MFIISFFSLSLPFLFLGAPTSTFCWIFTNKKNTHKKNKQKCFSDLVEKGGTSSPLCKNKLLVYRILY